MVLGFPDFNNTSVKNLERSTDYITAANLLASYSEELTLHYIYHLETNVAAILLVTNETAGNSWTVIGISQRRNQTSASTFPMIPITTTDEITALTNLIFSGYLDKQLDANAITTKLISIPNSNIFLSSFTANNFAFSVALWNHDSKWTVSDILSLPYRLPAYNFVPVHYDLAIQPNVSNSTFSGFVNVRIQPFIHTSLVRNVSTVVMHADEHLNLTTLVVTCQDQSTNRDMDFIRITEVDQIVIVVWDCIVDNIGLEYQGLLRNDMAGFFLNSATMKDGSEEVMAVTQFEPTDARKAYPCFDEPGLKATFNMAIVAPSNLVSLSNTAVMEERPLEGNMTLYLYETTPVMSTYLLAFAVGNFKSINGVTGRGTTITVWTLLDPTKLQFALSTALLILPFFEELLGIDFPLSKCDILAIPDFPAEAMENWGLIVFQESSLVLTDNHDSIQKSRVAYVLAHELAHQWFGNLVTCEWWDSLWLNEGFATYFQYVAIKSIFSSWKYEQLFVGLDLLVALDADAEVSTHALSMSAMELNNSGAINELFDGISYSKGGSILRMINFYLLQQSKFGLIPAVRSYLSAYSYSSANSMKFLSTLQYVSNNFATEANLHNWIYKPGYPIVTVEMVEQSTVFRQQPYSNKVTPANDQTWWVPMKINKKNGDVQWIEFNKTLTVLSMRNDDGGEGSGDVWEFVGGRASGFYRINYTESLWNYVTRPRVFQKMSPEGQAFLIGNAMDLTFDNKLDPFAAYELMANLNIMLPSYAVWSVACSRMRKLSVLMSANNTDFMAFVLKLFNATLSPYSSFSLWDQLEIDDHEQQALHLLQLTEAVAYNVSDVIAEGVSRFESKKKYISVVKYVSYSAVAMSSPQGWEKIHQLYLSETSPIRKSHLAESLTTTADPILLERILKIALNTTLTPKQDQPLIFEAVARNPFGGCSVLFNFLKNNWKLLLEDSVSFVFPRFIRSLSCLSSETDLTDLTVFFQTHDAEMEGAKSAASATVDRIQKNVQWRKQYQNDSSQWFVDKYDTISDDTSDVDGDDGSGGDAGSEEVSKRVSGAISIVVAIGFFAAAVAFVVAILVLLTRKEQAQYQAVV